MFNLYDTDFKKRMIAGIQHCQAVILYIIPCLTRLTRCNMIPPHIQKAISFSPGKKRHNSPGRKRHTASGKNEGNTGEISVFRRFPGTGEYNKTEGNVLCPR